MDAITRVAFGEVGLETSRVRFRKAARDRARPDIVARQAQISLLAFRGFADRGAALSFLHDGANGSDARPIDMAGRDTAGLRAAVILLSEAIAGAPQDHGVVA